MADSDFKNAPITFPDKWVANSRGGVIGQDKYKPDRSFKDGNGNVICVIESTSTNDRKVGVGELCLADKYFTDNKTDGILIFSLCGKSKYPPKPDTQAEYIEPYFKHIKNVNNLYGVREIYFIEESIFEALSWKALSEEFVESAVKTRA